MRLARLATPALVLAALAAPLAAPLATPLATPLAAQSPAAAATPSHRAAVARLLEVTRTRAMLEGSLETMLQGQLRQAPQLSPLAAVLREFYREEMSWATLEPDLTRLYLEVFTEPEVREMIAFYETPLGQKLLDRMPVVMARTQELTAARMQAAMPRLMQRLQDAAAQAADSARDTTRARRP